MAPGAFSCCFRDDFLLFLSFRGSDVRYGFVSHLYAALCRAGIRLVFDENFRRGREIWLQIKEAIERAKMSVIILSENFATSGWCLEEVALIVERHENAGQFVVPVLFRLSKEVVGQQRGSFEAPFATYDAKEPEIARRWRAALSRVVAIGGDRPLGHEDRPEAKVVDDIVLHVAETMNLESLAADQEGLVGIKQRMLQVKALLDAPSDRVCIISIWGMGGIGKSKLSGCVYRGCCGQFDGFCALTNFQKDQLQQELFEMRDKGYKNVLILLDGVENPEQIRCLTQLCVTPKFGSGTRILVPTRNRQVFEGVGSKNFELRTYEVGPLTSSQSSDLLKSNALGGSDPCGEYQEAFDGMLAYAGGNPRALIKLGKFLKTKLYVHLWVQELTRLKSGGARKDINDRLMISYNELDYEQQMIFLHIAFNFSGGTRESVTHELDSRYDATNGITSLVDRSLVHVDADGRLVLHSLHKAMAAEIVRKDSTRERDLVRSIPRFDRGQASSSR